ncbi:MAG: tetraacyldisaccharide 4'-kinase [Alphaproteobacteria bacterium]
MIFKTPKFWQKKGIIAILLLPLSLIYYFIYKINNLKYLSGKKQVFEAKIICIGNVVIGGSGKTPTCISLAEFFKNKGKKTAFVSKGYKRKFRRTIKVNPSFHKADEVGDEPLILANHAPTFVSQNRARAIAQAIKNGAEIIILDDGLQDESIKKDLSFLIVDGVYGFGNGFLFPAGPLRTKSHNYDEVIVINNSHKLKLAHHNATSVSTLPPKFDFSKNYIALCGIAHPEKFFNSLKQFVNLKVIKTISFPDHHHFTKKDANNLEKICKLHRAEILCTEKDYVKIKEFSSIKIHFANYEIKFKKKEELFTILKQYSIL